MKRLISTIFILFGLVGCATSRVNMASIIPGMLKPDVIQLLGEPESARFKNNLYYLYFSVHDHAFGRDKNNYVFVFEDNKLIEFAPLPEDQQNLGPIDRALKMPVFNMHVNK